MLQIPFMNGRSPMHWAISNIPSAILSEATLPALPPILSALIDLGGTLSAEALDEIEVTCCIRDSDALFRYFCPLTKGVNGEVVYTVRRLDECNFDFCINELPTRMLLEGRVDMKIIVKCERCNLLLHTFMMRLIGTFLHQPACTYSAFRSTTTGHGFFPGNVLIVLVEQISWYRLI